MLTPIRDDTRENQLLRALLAIESLAECESVDADMIYTIAHGVSGHCRACANSQGFELVEQCEAEAKARDLYDAEKELERNRIRCPSS